MKKILLILVVLFIIIQFFPINKTNPPVNKGMDFLTIKNTPEETADIIRTSCYDCHSNETVYPWYAKFQPTGWFLKNHIDEGRVKFNFSTFATYEPKRQAHKLEEAVEMIEKGEMPMESYVIMHKEAALNPEQKKRLITYFKSMEEDIRTEYNIPKENQK